MLNKGDCKEDVIVKYREEAAFEEIKAKRKGAAKVIGKYFDLLADLKNVSVAYRARKAEFSVEKAKDMFLPMGNIAVKDLLKIADNALLALLKKERYDMFSPAPIAGLYIGKLREIKNVRLLLARIANGVDKEIIKGRMRELYV